MTQIYLSPRKMLECLCMLEDKVAHPSSNNYQPLTDNSFHDNSDLEREALNMLKFVGLPACIPTCKFEDIQAEKVKTINGGAVAGYTLNSSSRFDIPIWVNKKFKDNPVACRAILAHEVCHRVIYLAGIDKSPAEDVEYNEKYCDLCTIYIGLGKQVLDGYIDSQSNSLRMGYLTKDMYRQAYDIMARTTGRYPSKEAVTDLNDPLLEEALGKWETPDKAKILLRRDFEQNEQTLAEMNRNILVLKQVLDKVYTSHGKIFRHRSDQAEAIGVFNARLQDKPLTMFRGVYESLFENRENATHERIGGEIANLILALTDEYGEIDLGEISYETMRCPNCGYESKARIEDRDATFKCNQCGIYFRFCNTRLNITKLRRQRADHQAKKARELEALRIEQQRLKNSSEQYANELEAKAKKAYVEGFTDGKTKITNQYNALRQALPGWLRFLVRNRLPESLDC